MSQSDYIQYKRSAVELIHLADYPSVLDSSDYTNFAQFTVENQVVNTSVVYHKMKPTIYNITSAATAYLNAQQVFDIERPYPSVCSSSLFPLCSNTNDRSNRTPPWWKDVAGNTNLATIIPFKPPIYVKHPTTQKSKWVKCVCGNITDTNKSDYRNPKTPYSSINPLYKKYKNAAVENSTFHADRTAYANRRLNQLMCNVCANTCGNTITI